MKPIEPRNRAGFSLVELLLSCGLFMMIILVVAMVFRKGNNLFDVASAESQVQRNSRKALQTVATTLRSAISSGTNGVTISQPDTIRFRLPVYRQAANSCSALQPDATATNPPVSCSVNTDCQAIATCGSNGSDLTCYCPNPVSGACSSPTNSGVCLRTYDYAISNSAGISQLVLSSAAGAENSRVVANQVQAIQFQNSAADPNLQSNEIRISVTTNGDVVSEKRTHAMTLSSVVQVRN